MKCVHIGDKAGVAFQACCGGNERQLDIYECLSPRQSADFCIVSSGLKGLATIQAHGAERRIATVAYCGSCPFREQFARPAGIPIAHRDIPKSNVKRMHEELRAKRNPPPDVRPVAVLDCSRHGFGDAIMAAWIAEGSKYSTPKLLLHATGEKKVVLEMLGQEVVTFKPTTTYGDEYVNHAAVGAPPSIIARGLKLGISAYPKRPTVTIPPDALEWAKSYQADILLFPQSHQVSRTWPHDYWRELYGMLRNVASVRVIGLPDNRWNACVDWMAGLSWHSIAALMKLSKVVVGNDSGPMHLAGTMDCNGVAILGRTTEVVFSMYPGIKCLAAEKREVPCVGCWSGWGYNHVICERGCIALSHVMPEQVKAEVVRLL